MDRPPFAAMPGVELRINAPLQECDVAVVSIDDRGLPGQLNRSVLEELGYADSDRPRADELEAGHCLVQRDGLKPIIFVVIVGIGKTEELLQAQLHRALQAYGERFFSARYWIPLLGTGRGGLSNARSLGLILEAIRAFRELPYAGESHFHISLPDTAEAQSLIEHVESGGGLMYPGEGGGPISETESDTGYFIMKMTPSTWYFPSIREGDATYFNTYFYKERRPEYELLHGLKPGDRVIGFAAGEMQQMWGLMEVTQAAHSDLAQGEIISLMVRRIFENPPSLSATADLFDEELVQALLRVNVPPRLVFPIAEGAYRNILERSGPAKEGYVNPFRPFYLTEGRHRETDDQLDFENDILSFATIISQKSVRPPLAIGLFGNWGSGKSFFMEKLEARIRDITSSGDAESVENVVHVRFNSWHYSDANLWASLITGIFEQLNAFVLEKHQTSDVEGIYRELELTRLQLSATKQDIAANMQQREALDLQQQQVQQERERVASRLEEFRAGNLLRVVFNDAHIQARIRKFNRDFDTAPIVENLDEISQRLDVLKDTWGRVREAWTIMRRYKGWKPVLLLALILIILPLCAMLMYRYRAEMNAVLLNLGIAATTLATALAALMKWMRPGLKTVNAMYRSLRGMQDAIEIEQKKLEYSGAAIVKDLEEKQQRLQTEEQRLNEQLKAAADKEEQLKQALSDIGSGKVLAGFLATKSADESYARQLGIISWIRKDFARLNSLFQNQQTVRAKQGAETVEIGIDRIVLYIDDLDRCSETVVVQVLEAIHLLLAFELFVVVVGVDPRWLNNALSVKYRKLFGQRYTKGVADSYDYLEKIFQIPFTLKPITDTGRKNLLHALLKAELQTDESRPGAASAFHAPTEDGSVATTVSVASQDLSPTPDNQVKQPGETPFSEEAVRKERAGELGIDKSRKGLRPGDRLRVSNDELVFMQQIAPLFGHTPRTINRYVNIYRLLKAHGSLMVKSGFSADDYQPLMLLLGIVVGCGALAEPFLRELDKAPAAQPFADFLSNTRLDGTLCARLRQLTIQTELLKVEDFQRNLDLVSRFSFRTLSTD